MLPLWAIAATLAAWCGTHDAGARAAGPEILRASSGATAAGLAAPAPEAGESISASPSASEHVAAPEIAIPITARPAWVGAAPRAEGEVYTISVDSTPFSTRAGAAQGLDQELESQAGAYIDEFLGHAGAAQMLGYSADRIHERLVRAGDYYEESRPYSLGNMQHVYARLSFDAPFHQELRRQWRDLQAWLRLARFGLWAVLGTAVLSTLCLGLRLDLVTRGLYVHGLRFATGATILALVAAGWWAAQKIPAL